MNSSFALCFLIRMERAFFEYLQVKGPDGTTFTFTDCTLSYNGTNHCRGQIPQILYFNTPQVPIGSGNANGPIINYDVESNAAREAANMTLTICQTLVTIAHDHLYKVQN